MVFCNISCLAVITVLISLVKVSGSEVIHGLGQWKFMKCIYNGWTHNELWNFKTLHQKSLKQLNGGARRTIDLQGRRSFEHQRHWVSRRRRNRSPNRRKRNRRRRPMSAMTCSQTFPPDTRSTTSCGVELCAAGGIQDCQMGYGCTQTSAYHVPVLLGHMILWALLRWDNPMRRWIAFLMKQLEQLALLCLTTWKWQWITCLCTCSCMWRVTYKYTKWALLTRMRKPLPYEVIDDWIRKLFAVVHIILRYDGFLFLKGYPKMAGL